MNEKFDGIVLNSKELAEMFGNDSQKAHVEKWKGFKTKHAENAVMRRAEQHYKIVEKRKLKNRCYYLLRKKRPEKVERKRIKRRMFPDEFYDKKLVVYSITNKINGKIYVGSTQDSLNVRIYRHKESMNENSTNYDRKIAQAFRKYGWDNFEFKILEQVEDKQELRRIESYWIFHLRSFENDKGYNNDLSKWIQINNNKGENK